MKVWAILGMFAMGVVLPLRAADEADTNKTGESTESKADAEKKQESPIQRLAELRLDENVVAARMINLPVPGKTRTVQEVLDRFDDWAKDEKVGAVLLDIGALRLSLADVMELRAAVEAMQRADKKVYAFLNLGGPNPYLLACAADEIAVAPTGNVIIPGVGFLFPFMKGHYQMRGIEFDVITAGRYKYGGFLNRREPNEYFKEEFGAIVDGWITDQKALIAEGRGLAPEMVDEAIDIALFDASEAQQRGLVDTLAYFDEYRDQLLRREKMKRSRPDDYGLARVNSIQDMFEMVNETLRKAEEARKAVGPKIAVLHARGPIVDFNLGAAFSSTFICRDDFGKVVDELRKNKSIKAVVMRIDSPGGSGYASDVIWKKLRRLGDEKPLVVSMGFVAGSGGYYIACPAHRIFAQPTTITGSIGVLGVFQSAWSLYNRMDYEFAEMARGDRALLGSPHRDMEKEDRAFLQDYIDNFYSIFIDRVAVTRKLPASEVRKIAEGRIWTGRDALTIGLVDELGGLADAIEAAREMAQIPPSAELKIVHYPRPSSLGEIFESFSSVSAEQTIEMFREGLSAAPVVGFEDQLMIFSAGVKPLCWMPIPAFAQPQTGRRLNWQDVGLSQSPFGGATALPR
ncbi:MAG: signal peptide peptidase SppA [Phycisphaerae bacterium]|jgi:protease-4